MAQQINEFYGPEEFNRIAEHQCNFCLKISDHCMTCENCSSVRYCSKNCQDLASERHKVHCDKIKDMTKEMNHEEERLRAEQKSNPFKEESVGKYWGLIEPRGWCRDKMQLGRAMVEAGMEEKNFYAFKVALEEHFMELLRLDHSDSLGIRDNVAFLLLFTRQYQKCYDLIAWFTKFSNDAEYDWGVAPKISKGQWKYLVGEDMLGELSLSHVETKQLLCLILLKMIIVRDVRRGKKFPSFSTEDLESEEIEAFRQCEVAKQEAILKRYLDQIEKKNTFVLKALVNPEPMKAMAFPDFFSPGSMQEARLMVEYAFYFKHFGMMDQIAQRLEGQDLNY